MKRKLLLKNQKIYQICQPIWLQERKMQFNPLQKFKENLESTFLNVNSITGARIEQLIDFYLFKALFRILAFYFREIEALHW